MSAEDYPVEMTVQQLEETREFWDDIIMNTDGTPNVENIYAELYDFRFLMEQVMAVYDHVTCGKMSKPMYLAHDVITVADQCDERWIRLAILEVLDRIESGESLTDLREEHTNEDD